MRYLDVNSISNLRLSISRATETVVAVRLIYHLVDARLHEIFQSAYKKGHSTETALTRIHNDILRAIHDGECVILELLDLSAAFDKTELLVLHARHRPQPPLASIPVCSDVIYSSNSAKNMGVLFDTVMSMDKQINSICQSAFYHLRNIAQVSKHISFRHCETLIYAFVTSKIDHYNILLSGLKQDQGRKLQYVQNSAARHLTGSRKHEHITPVP